MELYLFLARFGIKINCEITFLNTKVEVLNRTVDFFFEILISRLNLIIKLMF